MAIKTIDKLIELGLAKAPSFIKSNIHYQVVMGSLAYGVSTDSSDVDIYAFCVPPKEYIFPHLAGEIQGFSEPKHRFDQYQQHHILDSDGKNYDIQVYNIVKYFKLCMDNNPNMIDSLFVPFHYVIHLTRLGSIVRDNRRKFLHKGAWHKFKGYAYSQIHKIRSKEAQGSRVDLIEKHGYDIKFAYHAVRLMSEIEQILLEGDLELDRADRREQLKAIRRGDWTLDQVIDFFAQKEKDLETLYLKSDLQYGPNEEEIKALLLSCLEDHYGSLDKAIVKPSNERALLMEIKKLCEGYN